MSTLTVEISAYCQFCQPLPLRCQFCQLLPLRSQLTVSSVNTYRSDLSLLSVLSTLTVEISAYCQFCQLLPLRSHLLSVLSILTVEISPVDEVPDSLTFHVGVVVSEVIQHLLVRSLAVVVEVDLAAESVLQF